MDLNIPFSCSNHLERSSTNLIEYNCYNGVRSIQYYGTLTMCYQYWYACGRRSITQFDWVNCYYNILTIKVINLKNNHCIKWSKEIKYKINKSWKGWKWQQINLE